MPLPDCWQVLVFVQVRLRQSGYAGSGMGCAGGRLLFSGIGILPEIAHFSEGDASQ